MRVSGRIRLYHLFFLLFTLLLSSNSYADSGDIVKNLRDRAIELKLWQEGEWLNLVHYYENTYSSGYTSHADDPRFFNSPQGKTDPKSELLATIGAFYDTKARDDENAQCRFVARLDWLSKKLAMDAGSLPPVTCHNYIEWRGMVQVQRATLIFPTYHLNSPSSMFGHTLLRLDRGATEADDSKWLSYAVNFAANIASPDNSFLYAIKGLNGGYPGIFIVTPYFKKIQEYNRIEKRDIWEYSLNLTPVEIERMVKHLWELKEVNFDYYFFDENCSFRLLELLEVARPGLELTAPFVVTAKPIDTIKAIEDKRLIKDREFRSSQETELRALLEQLPEEALHLIDDLAQDLSVLQSPQFLALSPEHQKGLIDATYRYLRYQQTNAVRDDKVAGHSHALLAQLSDQSAPNIKLDIRPPTPPEQGHHSMRLTLGGGERYKSRYASLSFRMAFHSLEDNAKGFLRGAQINMFSGELRHNQDSDETKLQRLDVIDIFSLTPRDRFFKPISWKVYTGLERQLTQGQDRLANHVTGGAGVAYSLTQNAIIYGLGIGRLEVNRGFKERRTEAAYGLSTGLLWHLGPTTAHFELSGERFRHDEYRARAVYTHNVPLARNHALALDARYEEQPVDHFSDVNISYRYYFE